MRPLRVFYCESMTSFMYFILWEKILVRNNEQSNNCIIISNFIIQVLHRHYITLYYNTLYYNTLYYIILLHSYIIYILYIVLLWCFMFITMLLRSVMFVAVYLQVTMLCETTYDKFS